MSNLTDGRVPRVRNRFGRARVFGLGTVAVGLLLQLLTPREIGALPPGFLTPIIALEFATNQEDVRQLFETPGGSFPALLQTMQANTLLDFLFILLYTVFLVLFAVACAQTTARTLYWVAAGTAVVAGIADVLENVQLLAIFGQVPQGEFTAELARLRVSTWIKWGSLAAYFLMLMPYLRNQGGLARLILMLAAVPAILGVLAFLQPGLPTELFTLSTIFLILLLIVYAATFRPVAPVS
jgi:hypothetical protein